MASRKQKQRKAPEGLGASDRRKAQADILVDFLANAGIDLKHVNALQAVALMNGYKDYQTMRAADERACRPEAKYPWVVLTGRPGQIPRVHVNADLDLAYAGLLQTALMYVALFPKSEVTVCANDEDGGLTGVFVFIEDMLVAALMQPMAYEENEAHPIRRGEVVADDFRATAARLAGALALRTTGDVEGRHQRVLKSQAALDMQRDVGEMVRQTMAVHPESAGASELWERMQSLRLWTVGRARVNDGGVSFS